MIVYNLFALLIFFLESLRRMKGGALLIIPSFLLAVTFIGLRHEIGSDWWSYLRLFEVAEIYSFWEYSLRTDFLFGALSYAIYHLGGTFYHLNLISALVLFWGIYKLARYENFASAYFMLTLLPYLVIVVAPNYVRQAMALGFFFLSISYYLESKVLLSLAVALAAVFFHSSGVFGFLLVLTAVFYDKNYRKIMMRYAFVLVVLLVIFISDRLINKFVFYSEVSRISSGALPRLALYGMPFFMYHFYIKDKIKDDRFLIVIKVSFFLYLICIPITLWDSIIGDRAALYTLPAQAAIFAFFIRLSRNGLSQILASAVVLSYSFFQLNVWLFFSSEAQRAWYPYQNVLFFLFSGS